MSMLMNVLGGLPFRPTDCGGRGGRMERPEGDGKPIVKNKLCDKAQMNHSGLKVEFPRQTGQVKF